MQRLGYYNGKHGEPEEMMNADEVIIFSAGSLCLAASKIDGKPAGGKAGEMLRKIQDYVLAEFIRETDI